MKAPCAESSRCLRVELAGVIRVTAARVPRHGALRLGGSARCPKPRRGSLTGTRRRPSVPGRGLEDLARAAAMSRTTFAERFRDVAGTPPQSYLLGWRMLLARRELRSGDARVRPLALQLGYSSESAFSTAFKREVGESPLHYRARTRRDAQQLVDCLRNGNCPRRWRCSSASPSGSRPSRSRHLGGQGRTSVDRRAAVAKTSREIRRAWKGYITRAPHG